MNELMNSSCWDNIDNADIWWNQVSGPKTFLENVSDTIKKGQCIVLESDSLDSTFIDKLEKRIHDNDSSYKFCTFHSADYTSARDFINDLRDSIDPDFVIGFSNTPYKKMIEEKVLAHRLIYLDINDDSDWPVEVLNGFSRVSEIGNGVFAGLTSSLSKFDKLGKLKKFSLKQYLSIYSLQYFALQCLGNFEKIDSKRMYIAQLAAKLSCGSGCLCANLSKSKLFSDTMEVCHEFSLPSNVIDRAIWETQIQIFLPIIEEIRRQLIEKYADRISQLLPVQDEFKNKIEKPIDMELRHLKFYGSDKNTYFFSKGDKDWFDIAYNARNELSHLKLLNTQAMDSLFDIERALIPK